MNELIPDSFGVRVDVQKTRLNEQDKLAILEAFIYENFGLGYRGDVCFKYVEGHNVCDYLNETSANYIKELAEKYPS